MEFPGTAKRIENKAVSGDKKAGYSEMFTGTLIDDLIATVERAEQAAQSSGDSVAASMIADAWFSSVQESTEYDSKLFEVA